MSVSCDRVVDIEILPVETDHLAPLEQVVEDASRQAIKSGFNPPHRSLGIFGILHVCPTSFELPTVVPHAARLLSSLPHSNSN
jgi:hypothetical protein